MPAPDIGVITGDRTELELALSATHAQWVEIDSFTNGTYRVWPKGLEDRHTERTNRARSIVDHASDNILPYKPRFVRDEIDKVKEAGQTEDADDVEVASDALWTDATQAEMELPAKTAGRYMIKYNYGVLETGFSTKMPEKPNEDEPQYDAKSRAY